MVWPTLGSTTAEEQNRNLVINNPSYLKYVATLPCETLMSAKQAINDKLIGSVKCDEVVNNQIKKELLLSLRVIFFQSR